MGAELVAVNTAERLDSVNTSDADEEHEVEEDDDCQSYDGSAVSVHCVAGMDSFDISMLAAHACAEFADADDDRASQTTVDSEGGIVMLARDVVCESVANGAYGIVPGLKESGSFSNGGSLACTIELEQSAAVSVFEGLLTEESTQSQGLDSTSTNRPLADAIVTATARSDGWNQDEEVSLLEGTSALYFSREETSFADLPCKSPSRHSYFS